MRLSDRTTGFFLVGLGALAAFGGSRLPPVPGQQVGPNVFPLVIGLGLCVCGAMVAFGLGRRYEEEAEADLAASAAHGEVATHTGIVAALRVLLPPGLLLFYVFAVDWLGFIPTAAIIVFAAAFALGAALRLAVPLALLAPIAVHLVFSKLLRVPLPDGFVPMPW
jgi:putative tricarboxylic transport membrane protein